MFGVPEIVFTCHDQNGPSTYNMRRIQFQTCTTDVEPLIENERTLRYDCVCVLIKMRQRKARAVGPKILDELRIDDHCLALFRINRAACLRVKPQRINGDGIIWQRWKHICRGPRRDACNGNDVLWKIFSQPPGQWATRRMRHKNASPDIAHQFAHGLCDILGMQSLNIFQPRRFAMCRPIWHHNAMSALCEQLSPPFSMVRCAQVRLSRMKATMDHDDGQLVTGCLR